MKINKTGFDRSIMQGIVLVLLLFGLLTACAQAHRVGIKPSGPLTEVGEGAKGPTQSAPVGNRESLKEFLKDFQLKILTENHGICPGPDGGDMIFLGRGARLQLILMFTRIPSPGIKAGDLVARIAGLNVPFARRTSEMTFMTDIIDLGSLKHGLDTGPLGVSIFYKDRDKEILLGIKGVLAIDTIPPPKPVNLYVADTGPDYFSLTWENGKGEIKEYSVQIWDSGQWRTLRSGFSSPPVRLNSKPQGRVRVMAIDCALNKAFSEEVVLGSTWAGNKAKIFKAQKRDGIMVDANGPGSDILAGYFKRQASGFGLTIYEEKDTPAIAPVYRLKINVDMGRPQRLNVYGVYCWYVKASMKLSEESTGKDLVLHLRDIPDVDIRIYGKNLDQAIRGQGPNSFTEKIATLFIKEFMRELNSFLHTR